MILLNMFSIVTLIWAIIVEIAGIAFTVLAIAVIVKVIRSLYEKIVGWFH